MMLCMMRCKRAGFTLIEIMIVIAIIAILAGIVVPNFVQARSEARLVACQKNCETIYQALHYVMVRKSLNQVVQEITPGSIWGGFYEYTVVEEYLVPNGYLEKAPSCPETESPYDKMYGCGYDWNVALHKMDGTYVRNAGPCLFVDCPGDHLVGEEWCAPMYIEGYGLAWR